MEIGADCNSPTIFLSGKVNFYRFTTYFYGMGLIPQFRKDNIPCACLSMNRLPAEAAGILAFIRPGDRFGLPIPGLPGPGACIFGEPEGLMLFFELGGGLAGEFFKGVVEHRFRIKTGIISDIEHRLVPLFGVE